MSPLLLWLVRTSQCVVPWLCFHVRRIRSLARPGRVLLVWVRVLLQMSTTWFLVLALISRLLLRGVLNNRQSLVLPSVGILPLWDLVHLLRNVTWFLELAPVTPLPSRGVLDKQSLVLHSANILPLCSVLRCLMNTTPSLMPRGGTPSRWRRVPTIRHSIAVCCAHIVPLWTLVLCPRTSSLCLVLPPVSRHLLRGVLTSK
mmetsp:Transcript_8597/g.23943  ORF Transcript_8597/g.23943 Transcript_8597/m.23943 type:complete len:201 (-) Transcript_8597:320-922(-)